MFDDSGPPDKTKPSTESKLGISSQGQTSE